jgi:hypothetical protein
MLRGDALDVHWGSVAWLVASEAHRLCQEGTEGVQRDVESLWSREYAQQGKKRRGLSPCRWPRLRKDGREARKGRRGTGGGCRACRCHSTCPGMGGGMPVGCMCSPGPGLPFLSLSLFHTRWEEPCMHTCVVVARVREKGGASIHACQPTHNVAKPRLGRWFGGRLDKVWRIRDGVDKR